MGRQSETGTRGHADIDPADPQATPSVSLGAVIANPDDHVRSVLKRADAAMYAAKHRRSVPTDLHERSVEKAT